MVQDRDPQLVQAAQVQVALVLVKRLAGDQARAGERDPAAGAGQALGGVRPSQPAAPVGDQHGAGDLVR